MSQYPMAHLPRRKNLLFTIQFKDWKVKCAFTWLQMFIFFIQFLLHNLFLNSALRIQTSPLAHNRLDNGTLWQANQKVLLGIFQILFIWVAFHMCMFYQKSIWFYSLRGCFSNTVHIKSARVWNLFSYRGKTLNCCNWQRNTYKYAVH